jgi:Aspartyl/Asparaginyl beta-hydroxylase
MITLRGLLVAMRSSKSYTIEICLIICLGVISLFFLDIILGISDLNHYTDAFTIFDEVNNVVELQLGDRGRICIYEGLQVNDVFPDHKILEDHYKVILEEFYNVQESFVVPDMMEIEGTQSAISCTYNKDSDGNQGKSYGCGVRSQWKALQISSFYTDVPKTSRLMPKTVSLLNNCRRVVSAQISVLMPNTVLPWHRGFHKQHLRYHLALSIPQPDKAVMKLLRNDFNRSIPFYVAAQNAHEEDIVEKRWSEGEGFLLDDLMLHMVENTGDLPRVVLIVDVQRSLPLLSYMLDFMLIFVLRRHPFFFEYLSGSEPPSKTSKDGFSQRAEHYLQDGAEEENYMHE